MIAFVGLFGSFLFLYGNTIFGQTGKDLSYFTFYSAGGGMNVLPCNIEKTCFIGSRAALLIGNCYVDENDILDENEH